MSIRPRGPRVTTDGYFPWISVDVNDLRALETLLAQLGEVSITSDEFTGEAESIDEFLDFGPRDLSSLKVVGRLDAFQGQVAVSFQPGGAALASYGDDPRVAGVALQAQALLRQRTNRIHQLSQPLSPWLAAGAVAFAFTAVYLVQSDQYVFASFGSAVASLALGVVGLTLTTRARRWRTRIRLAAREPDTTWWSRNGDTLIVQLVVGAVLLVGGFLMGRAT